MGTSLRLAALFAAGSAACGRSPPAAELVLIAGSVITLDSVAPRARAIAIANGRIVAVGGPELAARVRGPGTRVIDLGAATVAPALVDHHVHLYNVGLALLNASEGERLFLDLSSARSTADVTLLVRGRASAIPPGAWVLGAGWSQGAFGTQTLPSHEPLTKAAPAHPVFLTRVDGHAGWANRAALAAAGLWLSGSDPPGGLVLRSNAGEADGVVLERANEPLTRLIPPPSDEDIATAFRLGAEALAARGITRVYDAGVLPAPGVVALDTDFGRYLRLLRAADSTTALPLDVFLMLPAPSRIVDSLLAAPPITWRISPRLQITHVKLFADGALGSRGAALTHPYVDDPSTTGVPRMTADEILELARRAIDRGLGVATHAIGDLAVARALDAYERLLAERPDLDPKRLRIEHFSYAREVDFTRAASLGVRLSIQSNFNALPDEEPTLGAMRVGADADERVYAWDRLERLGATLAEGSDYFTGPGAALANVVATLVRRRTVGAARPDSVGRAIAWRMNVTWHPPTGPATDPALRPGADANLVVLGGDPFAVARDSLAALPVLATLRHGLATYVAQPLSGLSWPASR